MDINLHFERDSIIPVMLNGSNVSFLWERRAVSCTTIRTIPRAFHDESSQPWRNEYFGRSVDVRQVVRESFDSRWIVGELVVAQVNGVVLYGAIRGGG